MPRENEPWSTPKFLLIVTAVTLVLMFTLNGVLNEIMHLGINGASFGAATGIVIACLLPRWGWFRRRMLARGKPGT